ncbi:tRNA glutamyl-Q(34) synthetase GluQRS [Halomonas denitrificans]|nr:tRNA glutamyl-Q(34) synthetase GluQRS [Halomonas denitrificans]
MANMVAAPEKDKQQRPDGRAADRAPYRGRFAPSPTGPLHFGSLVAAVGSYLQARHHGGRWTIRIEDIDPPRVVAGAARDQLETLARFGLRSDGPVVRQIDSTPLHRDAVQRLLAAGRAFPCCCSRSDLPASGVYPGTCRDGLPPGSEARSIRFRVPEAPVRVRDRLRGEFDESLAELCGDVVIRRADGFYAYQLAVVVDDLAAGITEVVRGADLLDSSGRQQALFEALGAPPPAWMHLPLVVDSTGRKLSKSTGADPVASRPPREALALALTALGHRPPSGVRTLDSLWSWALEAWTPEAIPTEAFEL